MEFEIVKNPMSTVEIKMNKDEMIRADGGVFVFKNQSFSKGIFGTELFMLKPTGTGEQGQNDSRSLTLAQIGLIGLRFASNMK